MKQSEQVQYLANLYYLARSEGKFQVEEDYILQEIAKEIGAGYLETRKALDMSMESSFKIKLPARLSDRIRTLEDMLLVAYHDGTIEQAEKKIILTCSKEIGIDQKEFDTIKDDAKRRLAEFKKSQP